MWHDKYGYRAPRKRKKQVISEVAARYASRPGAPEKEKASNFRGGCLPRKPAGHPGEGKTTEIPPFSKTTKKKNEKILLFLLTK